MGATGPVHVEELVAKHSIEEIMNRMVSGEGTKEVEEVEEDHVDFNETRAKIHRLLKSVKLIRVHHSDNTKKRKLAETVTPSRVRVAVRFQE
jgi:arginine repressor